MPDSTNTMVDFAGLLLGALGFTDGEFVSLLYEPPEPPHTAVRAPADAVAEIGQLPGTANIYFGVNPTEGPARTHAGRGTEAAVTRLAALWCELDVKPGGCATIGVVHQIIDNLSAILGARPSVIVNSGHGVHAYWAIDDGAIGEQFTVGRARALVRRWGRLVAVVADKHHAHADNVFDLARMLRVPGTLNNKSAGNGAAPIRVTAYTDTGGPLTVAEIDERLAEVGILEEPGDTDADSPEVSPPAGWVFAQRTCPYVAKIVNGLPTDGPLPGKGRHQWPISQSVKLACAHRCGCITEDDYHRAKKLLAERFAELVRTTEPRREPRRYEIDGKVWSAWEYGIKKAAAKTDEQARAELGNHTHDDDTSDGDDCPDEPIPLTPNTVDVPSFPVDALPTVYATMVTELAEATQTDPAMAGTSALSVLAASAGGHAKIEVRRGWREPLCLHTSTIARPAERKSAVQAAMAAPLYDAEAAMSVAGELERLKLADELDMAKKTVDQLNKAAINAAAKAAGPDATDADRRAAAEAAKVARDAKTSMRGIQVPVIPRLLADDATPEATASLLAEHGGRIAIISAEGGIFDTIAGRYARTVNMDVYLKGHSGDRIRVDRQGRPAQHIPSPALTLGLMVQPRVIEAIAANRDFVGRGLLARFLYATPVSRVGSRASNATPVSADAEDRYSKAIKKLASDMAGWADDPAVLVLDERAEVAVRRIQDALEPTLAGDGELASPASLSEWGGKYVGAVVRIAGLLHLAQHGAGTGVKRPVQAETIGDAERIGRYFKAAAINVFSQIGAGPDIADAMYLLERVARLGADEVSERELLVASSRSRFPTKADMAPALKRLVNHGYLIPLVTPKPTGGGRVSPRFKVHPATIATIATDGSR
jgi:replicative DNA helicase